MKRLLFVLLAGLMFSNVYADGLKIGVINLDQVLQKSPLALSYNEKIASDFKPRQDQLNTAQAKLQDELDKLNYGAFKMSQTDRTALQNTINDDKRQFDLMNSQLQKDLSAAQSQYTQQLMGKLNTVIAKLGKDGKYDIIQTTNNVLYLNTAIDLTPQVITELK